MHGRASLVDLLSRSAQLQETVNEQHPSHLDGCCSVSAVDRDEMYGRPDYLNVAVTR